MPKRALRVMAWAAGVASFLSPWAVLGLSPKLDASAMTATQSKPRVIIRQRVVQHVVWVDSPVSSKPQVRYVYVAGGQGGGGGAAPAASTGGSHP